MKMFHGKAPGSRRSEGAMELGRRVWDKIQYAAKEMGKVYAFEPHAYVHL